MRLLLLKFFCCAVTAVLFLQSPCCWTLSLKPVNKKGQTCRELPTECCCVLKIQNTESPHITGIFGLHIKQNLVSGNVLNTQLTTCAYISQNCVSGGQGCDFCCWGPPVSICYIIFDFWKNRFKIQVRIKSSKTGVWCGVLFAWTQRAEANCHLLLINVI